MSLHLLVEIAGQRVAFAATAIEAVADLGDVVPIPFAPAHVAGLAAIRSQLVTVVDASVAVGAGPGTNAARAVLINHEGHRFAIGVDRVIDVVDDATCDPLETVPLSPEWRAVATGRLTTLNGFALLLDPARLINPPVTLAG